MRILLAPDKFKGSISGPEICEILTEALTSQLLDVEVISCPLADGGDGSLEVLDRHLNLQKEECTALDPLGRSITTSYFMADRSAYIELASASGLVLLKEEERNPMKTSTYGTGLQIKDAIDKGARHIYLFLGGSATNDGGMGISAALGFIFCDKDGNELELIGASLNKVAKILPPEKKSIPVSITLCCDVDNEPIGKNGAAHIYAKQKGASANDILHLDAGMENLCKQLKKLYDKDITLLKGGGAAGGVPVCLVGLMDAEIESGIKMIATVSDLETKIVNADLVISGEGRIDHQSLSGKVVSGVSELCKKHQTPLWLVVGKNELAETGMKALAIEKLFSIYKQATDLQDAMTNGKAHLKNIGQAISLELKKRLNNK